MPKFRRDADLPPNPTQSLRMKGVRGKNTSPEMRLRRALHANGLRYRCHLNALPGRPDIAFTKAKVAVLVHGCFWHRHGGCASATMPRVNERYWLPKLRRNVERDRENAEALTALGYRVIVAWECEVRAACDRVVASIRDAVRVPADK